ncbi:imidazole glycerol phosphate synthase subunit HisH [Candidatus Saccharibacteria bacterium]|nr:imidazole glycerol phosphate synthase subunit HisH [Candidatus Saccharibacteria bacterium]NIW80398.1 imidazole glycerol phosphate synthase subunit HisH [Calditrichia bacterium]
MKVAVLKYNAGNIHSMRIALRRLGIEPVVTDDPNLLAEADKVIFPGVGEASSAMRYLQARELDKVLKNFNKPLLGICLGLQLMCRYSEENDTRCLEIFDTAVRKFPPKDKVPHMGWNSIHQLKGALFQEVNEGEFVYFVHSYYAEFDGYTASVSNYIVPFSASLNKSNYFAVQFHPEKSGAVGEQILKNFLNL